jgi:chemotaxis protein methyltransferase CheR
MTRALTIHQNNIHLFFQMLEENVGIALDHSKEYLVASRLAVIARANHFKDHHALIQHLLVNPIGILHHQSFQAMTTNETMFFRDKFPFDTLRTTIIPALIAKCRDTKTLSIWCAAASSGQEPYSLAILLRENFPELYYWKINFIATDISEPALKQARSGTYSETEIKRGLTDEQIKRYFKLLPNGQYEINAELRQMIRFESLNLVKDWPVMPKFDLILIRNVLIYFNAETKAKIFNKLRLQLVDDGGCLLLGSSESILYDQSFKVQQADRVSYYCKDVSKESLS